MTSATITRRREALDEAARSRGITLHEAELGAVEPLLEYEAPASRLRQNPRLARWLLRTPWVETPRPPESFRDELTRLTRLLPPGAHARFDRILRRFRHREMLRIALRDVTRRAPLLSITGELAHLADALLEAALAFHDRAGAPSIRDRFCVIAMGKHGGLELNYSSDIDVLFLVADADLRERAIVVARQVIRSLSTLTEDGFAFRVDANLRPYGRDGTLVNTPEELERYYERAGQTWERAALLKARPCAGAIALGEQLVASLRPFVFRRSLDLEAVESIALMKRRIDGARQGSTDDDVKLGHGGIREIEFFAQAFQLLHAGRQPRLRARATLEVLNALVLSGIVAARDRDALAEAYLFLRDVEHRVQLPGDEQTHRIPPEGSPARSRLAHRMGFANEGAFETALAGHRSAVHHRFTALLATAEDQPRVSPDAELALSADEHATGQDAALRRLGFEEVDAARAALNRLARQPDGAFGPRGRERHPLLAERLVNEMARSPSPDVALTRFSTLATPLWDPAALASLLDASPATARVLVLLFATSEALARDFQLHPELLDALVRSDGAALAKGRATVESELAERLREAGDAEARLSLLRRVRHEETLRIGLHDLAGRLAPHEVVAQLSVLAEALLDATVALARGEVAERFGEPPGARGAVLGLGSLGGGELGYESDLDLVFIHDASGTTTGGSRGSIDAGEWAARVAQKVLSHLTMPTVEGLLYRVDARLRPSGSAGPLVASLAAFGAYHRGETPQGRGAALWERQALLRARFVSGDHSLGAQLEREVLEPVARRPVPDDVARQIHDMRLLLDVTPAYGTDPKKGPGGLLDVEFATQLLCIVHGLREPSTIRALDLLRERGILGADAHAELTSAWHFLRRIESRLRLIYGRPEVFVPRSGEGLARIARQLGDPAPEGGERLLRELDRTMRRTRGWFDRIVH